MPTIFTKRCRFYITQNMKKPSLFRNQRKWSSSKNTQKNWCHQIFLTWFFWSLTFGDSNYTFDSLTFWPQQSSVYVFKWRNVKGLSLFLILVQNWYNLYVLHPKCLTNKIVVLSPKSFKIKIKFVM
jgi:hypothetical protein